MGKLQYFVFALLLNEVLAVFNNIQTATYNSIPEQCLPRIDPAPFVKIGNKYYAIEVVQKANWFEAGHHCRALGGDLATIESDAELTALSNFLLEHNQRANWFWVGGSDLAKEGLFKFSSNGLSLSFTKWSPGQPDNAGGNENCVHLWIHAESFHMNDYVCKNDLYYICEMKNPQVISFTVW